MAALTVERKTDRVGSQESTANPFQLGRVLLVGVLDDLELLGVGVIAGVDPHHLHPARRFQGGLGLEMDVRDDRYEAAPSPQLRRDVLKIGRVLHRRRRDPDDLAPHRGQLQRLPHALGRVHGVAGEHGLHHHGFVSADDHPAPRRVTDHHGTGPTTFELES